MRKRTEYRFKIDAFTPETIPMARLAEYMTHLAKMLGEPESVRFVKIAEGSAQIVSAVDDVADPKVRERISGLPRNAGPRDALKAYREINKQLRADNAVGVLTDNQENNVVKFPGREAPEPLVYGPVRQEGFIDGRVIMVGGKGETVPVHVQQGEKTYNAKAPRPLAAALGRHLFNCELRLYGSGRWLRDASGEWKCEEFNVSRFEVLTAENLSEAVAEMRGISGSGWTKIDDVWSELAEIRGGEE